MPREAPNNSVLWDIAEYTHPASGESYPVAYCMHPDTRASDSLVLVQEGLGGGAATMANAVGKLSWLPLVGVVLDFPEFGSDAGIEGTLHAGPKAVEARVKWQRGIDRDKPTSFVGSSLGAAAVIKIVHDAPGEWGDIGLDKPVFAAEGPTAARDIAIRVGRNGRTLAAATDPEARVEAANSTGNDRDETHAKLDYAVRQPGIDMLTSLVNDPSIGRGRCVVIHAALGDEVSPVKDLRNVSQGFRHPRRVVYFEEAGPHYGYATPGGVRQLGRTVEQLPDFAHLRGRTTEWAKQYLADRQR